jgi:ATPase family associated with various cellular activities (AAA)
MNRPHEDLPLQAHAPAASGPVAPAWPPSWPEQNQRWLTQRFAALCQGLAVASAAPYTATGAAPSTASTIELGTKSARRLRAAPLNALAADEDLPPGFEPAALRVQRLFGLSPFELDLLLLAVGAECDGGVQQALRASEPAGAAGNASALGTGTGTGAGAGTSTSSGSGSSTGAGTGITPNAATGVNFALALAHLPQAHWDAISPLAPLRYWQLLHTDGAAPWGQARLRVDERVLHHITGVAALDGRLAGVAQLLPTHAVFPPAETATQALAQAMANALGAAPRPLLLLHAPLHQPLARRAARAVVLAAMQRLQLQALWVDCSALEAEPAAAAALALALDREAALSGAALVLASAPQAPNEAEAGPTVWRLLQQLRSPVVLLGPASATELAELPERRCWRFALPTTPAAPTAALAPAATGDQAPALRQALQQFQVDEDTLQQALQSLPEGSAPAQGRALWQALRQASRGGLDGLAQRITTQAKLADLVLPAAALDTLRSMVQQLRHRAQVHEDWGFAAASGRGLGLAALFAGDSGTGKTFAAEAVANEAELDLYRVDLALTVSKYIGETEKNLRRLFDAAEASGAVLLFDEADALFGKRSEVKDSHDRYANIEVSYLLQRIESYRGLAILTTNLKSSLDRAFLRRLRFVVNFPFPDEPAREALWRQQFPPQAPLAADVDWHALARLHLTGGHIRGVALNGAFRAAADGGAITQRHLMDAARAEYAKLERSFGGAGAGS